MIPCMDSLPSALRVHIKRFNFRSFQYIDFFVQGQSISRNPGYRRIPSSEKLSYNWQGDIMHCIRNTVLINMHYSSWLDLTNPQVRYQLPEKVFGHTDRQLNYRNKNMRPQICLKNLIFQKRQFSAYNVSLLPILAQFLQFKCTCTSFAKQTQ